VTEDEIKAEMRLYVIEYFVATLFATQCLAAAPADPLEAFAKVKKQMLEGAQKQTFAGLHDPAMSDLFSAELESAVAHLASLVDEQIGVVVKARRRKTP
jgi:hypothetical protein